MTTNAPPLQQPLTEQGGGLNLLWMLFFNQMFQGDAGVDWLPSFQNLSVSGGVATILGRVYQISKYLAYFRLTISPPSGGNTSATAGTTYIDNFPYTMQGDGVCADVSNKLGGALGMCEQSSNRIWVPGWTTVTNNISIAGLVEAE